MAVILIVEDDAPNQEMLIRFLRRGHHVRSAADGVAGVKAATEFMPNLIVMDLGLPGIDGWEATRRIRNNPVTAHIPIIALTAHTLSEDVNKAMKNGVNSYETKPVAYPRLMRKIAAMIKA
jgi:CheY-like chemotaxis protein